MAASYRSASPGRLIAERFEAQHQWYQSRLSRARSANIITRTSPAKKQEAEAAPTAETSSPSAAIPRKVTELRCRLRVLAQKDEHSWSLSQMKAALILAGYSVNVNETKASLRSRTKALAAAEGALAAAEAEAAEAAELEAAAAAAAAANKQNAARKFRSRSRALLRARNTPKRKGAGGTHRDEDSSDDEITLSDDEEIIDSSRSQPSSYRASFRQRGATFASARGQGTPMKATADEGNRPAAALPSDHDAVQPMLALMRSLLLPEFTNGTPWATHVSKCLASEPAPRERPPLPLKSNR